ncbi:unnamed protein product, partial [Mesorhabditis spiculigera]
MWLTARELSEAVLSFNAFEDETAVAQLLDLLKKYQWKLQNVTKNSDKPVSALGKLQNANGSIEIGPSKQKVQLNAKMCEEATIMGRIFSMEEKDAVELVLTGDLQVQNFDEIGRGLTAVVCYYDAHKLFARTLKCILSWDREQLPVELENFIAQNLVKEAVFRSLLEVQSQFTMSHEFQRLVAEGVNGLGGDYHQQLVRCAIDETRNLTSECAVLLCLWAGDKTPFLNDILRTLKEELNGPVRPFQFLAWTCLAQILHDKSLLQTDNPAKILKQCHNEIKNQDAWVTKPILGAVALALASAINSISVSTAHHSAINDLPVDIQETLVEMSVSHSGFHYLEHCVTTYDAAAVPYQIESVDYALKRFCCQFPALLTELMRSCIDELLVIDEWRGAKGYAPKLRQDHFRVMLSIFRKIYHTDKRFAAEYSATNAMMDKLSEDFSPEGNLQLCNAFLALFQKDEHNEQTVEFIQTLTNFCRNGATASFVFNMFCSLPLNIHFENCSMWSKFFSALKSYEKFFRNIPDTNFSELLSGQGTDEMTRGINPEELTGLVSWCRLVEADPTAAQGFASETNWGVVDVSISLVGCKLPGVLKGALLKMLAAMARLPIAAGRIWKALEKTPLCHYDEKGQLAGLVNELEENECPQKEYDCSLGMLQLLRQLSIHREFPEIIRPYLEYIIAQILGPLNTRAYLDNNQMWDLCENGLSTLSTILDNNVVDFRALEKREPAVVILLQLANRDTPLFKSIGWTLCEDAYSSAVRYRPSANSSFLALKLLKRTMSLLEVLREAKIASSLSAVVSTIPALFLSPISLNQPRSLFSIFFKYASQMAEHGEHALLSLGIVGEMCAFRPSLQRNMVETLLREPTFAARLPYIGFVIFDPFELQYTIDDVYMDNKSSIPESCAHVRGELARLFVEMLADSVETDPRGPNLGYLFCGIDMMNPSDTSFTEVNQRTVLHRLLPTIEMFSKAEKPFALQHSAIIQPAFRFLRGLVSVECPVSPAILRFLRTHDAIHMLATSPFMGFHAASMKDDSSSTKSALSDMVAGDILHLIALEISSLLLQNQFVDPQRLLRALLESVQGGADPDMNTIAFTNIPEERNVLFALLSSASGTLPMEAISPATCVYFDAHKVQALVQDSLCGSVWGIPVYDVDTLHQLLDREIRALEYDDKTAPSLEMEKILDWVAVANQSELISQAHATLLSGCSALINVICLFTPLPFFSHEAQIAVLSDACYELITVASTHDGDLGDEICTSILRVCKALCKLITVGPYDLKERRILIERLIAPVFELLVQPGNRTLRSKTSLYLATCSLTSSCYSAPTKGVESADFRKPASLDDTTWLFKPIETDEDPIRARIDSLTQELSRFIIDDIADLPNSSKCAPLSLLADLIWEDGLGTRKTCVLVARSGVVRFLLDLLQQLDINYEQLAQADPSALETLKLFKTINVLLTRLSFVDAGWVALTEIGTIQILSKLKCISDPPKDLYLNPASINTDRSIAWYYGKVLTSSMCLVSALFSNAYWRKLSKATIDFILAHAFMFSQLCRAEVSTPSLDQASSLLHFIYERDDVLHREAIDASPSLKMIRNRADKL